jgi:transmembrane sensor
MNEQVYNIIAKVLKGEASAEEEQYLRDWRAADAANEAEYEELRTFWEQADTLSDGPVFDTDAAWRKVSAVTTGLQEDPHPVRRVSLIPLLPKVGLAAAVLLAGLFLFRFFAQPDMVALMAGNSNRELILPDQSHVVLRQGSTIRYPARFARHERRVTLDGEAFFEVQPGKDHPFIVDAGTATVRVIGTSFNVACDEEGARVTVATGTVQMDASAGSRPGTVVLTAGEQGRLKKGQLTKDFVSSDSYLYWKTGVLQFREEPFSNVIRELGNMSQISIAFDPSMSADQRSQMVSISFKDQTVEEMLTDLCLITHCEWSAGNDGYTIRAIN